MKTVILILIIGFIILEVIEHVIIPLFFLKHRKKQPLSGVLGMLGDVVVVKEWEKTTGQVFFKGELWKAVSDIPLTKGEKAVIREIEGLTLRVEPLSPLSQENANV